MPLLQGKAPSPRKEFYYFAGRNLEAVREGSWKCRFTRSARTDLKPGDAITPELFNLDFDPAEQYNVYDRYRETGDRLLKKLRAFGGELKAALPL